MALGKGAPKEEREWGGKWRTAPSIRNSDDAIILTTLSAETIYKSVSRQVTLNYKALYYGAAAEDA